MFGRLRRLLNPPIFGDEEKTRISHFLTIFSWAAICVILLAILFRAGSWNAPNNTSTLILAGLVAILLIMQYALRLGHVRTASILAVLSMWVAMTALAIFADGLRDIAVIAYIAVILLASILLGWRYVFLFGLMSISSIWYLAIMEERGRRPTHIDTPLNYAWDLTGILLLVGALSYLLITSWTRTLLSARVELMERLRAEERLQRQADYLAALHETALGILNRSELFLVLESILTRTCELIGTQNGWIDLVLPDESALKQHLGRGMMSKYDDVLTKKGRGVTGCVWASGHSLAINDYPHWENALPEFVLEGFRAVAGVPLKLGENVIGVLAVSHVHEDDQFTSEQMNLMERFGTLAAIAIHNTHLSEQIKNELQERRTAELELRASEERFRKVFQASPVAICITTLEEGRLLEANDAYWELSGYEPAASIGHTADELELWDSPELRRDFVEHLKQQRSINNPELTFSTVKNEQRFANAFYQLFELRGQTRILTMLYDITPQKRAQTALQGAEARTRALLTAIPDMIFEISISGVITGFIPSTEINPTLPPELFLGKHIRDFFPSDIVKQTLFAIERALETGQLHAFEYSLPENEGIRFFEARVSAISADLAMIMVRDISQRKWIETEREKLIQELEDKNAELERFTYAVSHDLKSPLITIKGFLGFLEQDTINGNVTRLKADMKRISDATDKMQSLLNELLELSRVGRLMNPYEQIPFEDIAREAVELVQGRLLAAHAEVHIQKNLPSVYGDRRRLLEVLQNLVDNAAKFFGDQPQPRIEIGHTGEEEGRPIFFVRDNGVGIEQEHLGRIWGLFNKLNSDSEGTGIGLTLVKRIVEVHHGRIWVESEAGKGSTFFFTLQKGPEV